MLGLRKLNSRAEPVYFGHPTTFWQGRRGNEQQLCSQVDAYKQLSAVVRHGDTMHRRLVHRRVESRVQEELQNAERGIEKKRERLRQLLESDREAYIQEMATLEARQECQVCEERNTKAQRFEENLEREKVLECQRALEHEQIAYGMKSGKQEEVELRRVQRLQMKEREHMNAAERERDGMWHRVLMDDWRKKEAKAQMENKQREQQMRETRRTYDEHIASANRERAANIRVEREWENRRLEAVRDGLEKEREQTLIRKKEQQKTLEQYFDEDRRCRLAQRARDKMAVRALDDAHIRRCQEEIKKEEQRQRDMVHRLQVEKKVFMDCFTAERRAAAAMEEERDKANELWSALAQKKADELRSEREDTRKKNKEEASQLYKQYQMETDRVLNEERRRRDIMATSVRKTALENIRRDLREAEKEIEQQKCYRDDLSEQIRSSQDVMKQEKFLTDKQQYPFVSRSNYFRDAMITKIGQSPGLRSSLPVHPFARILAPIANNQDTANGEKVRGSNCEGNNN